MAYYWTRIRLSRIHDVLVLDTREALQEGFEPEHARDRTERHDARENRRLLLKVAKRLFANGVLRFFGVPKIPE